MVIAHVSRVERKVRFTNKLTLEEFKNLEFEYFYFQHESIEIYESEAYRRDLVSFTWHAWLCGHGGELSFRQYLDKYNLGEKENLTESQAKDIAIKAYSIAEKIRLADLKK